MLGQLQSEVVGFHHARVKPSQETTVPSIRMSKKMAGTELEAKDWEVRERDGLHCILPARCQGEHGRKQGQVLEPALNKEET